MTSSGGGPLEFDNIQEIVDIELMFEVICMFFCCCFVFLSSFQIIRKEETNNKQEKVLNYYYNPKSEKVGTVWKTQIKKESSDF